jgi:phage FluMu protein Com
VSERGNRVRCQACATLLGTTARIAFLWHFKSAPGVQVHYRADGALEIICPSCGKFRTFTWERNHVN